MIKKEDFHCLGDKKKVLEMRKESVEFLYKEKHYSSLFILICKTLWDLGDRKKENVIKLIRDFFPDMIKEIDEDILYEKYILRFIEGSRPEKGYAIAEDHEVGGKYIDEDYIEGKKGKYKLLNLDRLTKDFLSKGVKYEFN